MDTFGLKITGGSRPPTQLDFHLAAFAKRLPAEKDGWGPVAHFKWIAEQLFGRGKSDFRFLWHSQVDEIVEAYCNYDTITVAGHASSSKSCTSALWAIINWLSDPEKVKVAVVSTDLKGARKRIWGDIENMFYALPSGTGNIVKVGLITNVDPTGQKKFSDKSGIELVAGSKDKEEAAKVKMRGFKVGKMDDNDKYDGRMIVIIDEGPGVADGIYETFYSNVLVGNKHAQLIALGNFDSSTSVFGQMCEPVEGWESTTVEDEKWETEKGVCIHLDGLKSHNYIVKKDEYEFMLKYSDIKAMEDAGLTNTMKWWRDIRSYPAPAGMGDGGVATLSELTMFKATKKVHPEEWKSPPVLFPGLDPAYVSGGDDPILYPLAAGTLENGEHVLCFYEPALIQIDASNKVREGSYQVADYCASYCIKAGTPKGNLGYDSTNEAFGQVFRAEFGREGYAVQFGGSASEDRWGKRGPNGEPPPRACDVFTNRVSELHGIFLEFLRAGRIRGIDPNSKLCKQILMRKWVDMDYSGGKPKMKIETKRDMKKRTGGVSPDHLDAAIIALAAAIKRLGITAGTGPIDKEERAMKRFERMQKGLINTPTLSRHLKGGSGKGWRQLFQKRR